MSSRMSALFLAMLLSVGLLNALLYLRSPEKLGFPLDDAWIHQTYARNLSKSGQWVYNLGEPSSGSTSPAWTALLAVGYWISLSPFVWTYLWGSAFYVGTAVLAALLSLRYFGDRISAWFVGILCLIEWHMAWAALSGMEITLFAFLTLLYLWILDKNVESFWLGAVSGLATLVRPEGIILAATYAFKWWFNWKRDRKRALRVAGLFVVAYVLPVIPLAAFNWLQGGRPFPQTVAAKYLQYGATWTLWNAGSYVIRVIMYFVKGPLLLIVPCALITVYQAYRGRNYRIVYPLAWMVGLVSLYAVSLPVIYHHGRYLMPLIPIAIIYGVEGLRWLAQRFSAQRFLWMSYRVATFVMVAVLWVNGASTYALQVDLLAKSHWTVADWVRTHTPQDAVIAAHDIGLVGYYGGRRLVDLAGLVTHDVVPILHDQQALAEFSEREGVSYLVLFTGYYQPLIKELNAQLVFSPQSERLRGMGLEPLEVYQVR